MLVASRVDYEKVYDKVNAKVWRVKRMFFSLTPVVIACNQHGLPRFEKNLKVCRFASDASNNNEC